MKRAVVRISLALAIAAGLVAGCGSRSGLLIEQSAGDGGSLSAGAAGGVPVGAGLGGTPAAGGGAAAGGSGKNSGGTSGAAGANAGGASGASGASGAAGGSSGTGGMPQDPCLGIECTSPPALSCQGLDAHTAYAKGVCSAGQCSYGRLPDVACGSNTRCNGGLCSVCKGDASCGADCTACTAGTPRCKDLGTTSQCVGCLSNGDCRGAKSVCDTTTNLCVVQPSCSGLAATCGPKQNENCCASSVVTGVTTPSFYRSDDGVTPGCTSPDFPAQVTDFRLDDYEITVGRFHRFWRAYPRSLPAPGSGKNPNDPNDTGWDATWNSTWLARSQAELTTDIECDADYQTWTAGKDNLPMNCLDWFEAEAFCIWDGGRLPTEAEWNYAAAGGTEQRMYPWGSAVPGPNTNLAVHGCYYGGGKGTCTGVVNIAPAGSIAAGNGRFGQADLAGNVWEWVHDGYFSPYAVPCIDCTTSPIPAEPVFRGGGFGLGLDSYLLACPRYHYAASAHVYHLGARCARAR